jgi:methylmalonyl-CoA/ethylmalonyl-CoA epimerase
MLQKIDHVGIAVHSVENVKTLFLKYFHMTPVFEETVPEQKVRVAGFKLGESNLEFLEPTDNDSPIARFLEKKGQGLHHISVGVKNIDTVLKELREKNVNLIDEKARIGAEGKKIAFVHPKSVFGILLELSQEIYQSDEYS